MGENDCPLRKLASELSAQTRIYYRGSDDHEPNECINDYKRHAYQYATTSHECNSMSPAAIIYPKNINDRLHEYFSIFYTIV